MSLQAEAHRADPPRPLGDDEPEPLYPERVLFFGKNKSRSCCTGALVNALREHGLRVKWINWATLKRWLGSLGARTAVRLIRRRFRPDLCFVFFHDLPSALMEEFAEQIPTVVWMEEQTKSIHPSHIDYVRSARLLCLSTPRLVREYRELGIRQATFLMTGFSPSYHRPVPESEGPQEFERDLVFIGGPGHMGDRPSFLSWLSEHHDLEIFGLRDSWLPHLRRYPNLRIVGEVRPADYARVCARSRIVIGLNQSHDSELYFSNRFFLTPACLGFHLTRYVPRMEEVFGDGEHLAWFRSREECLEKIAYYLERDDERARIARAGFELARRKHRYEDRVADILAILRNEKRLSCPVESVRAEEEVVRADAESLLHPSRDGSPLPPFRRASGTFGS